MHENQLHQNQLRNATCTFSNRSTIIEKVSPRAKELGSCLACRAQASFAHRVPLHHFCTISLVKTCVYNPHSYVQLAAFYISHKMDEECCPLCAEEMDATDLAITYCQCDYRMCLWCWNQLMETAAKEALPGRCPNCRSEYDKEKITMSQMDPDV